MKLLDWMHRKFRQNSSEALKDFTFGHSCYCLTRQSSPDDHQFYSKPNHGTKTSMPSHRDYLRNSFAGVEAAARVDEDDHEEDEASSEMSELFHGFLAIGTLGSDPNIPDPSSTPTFTISEVTENELKLINDELEKVLGSEDSSGRSSHGSTITLSGKPIEGRDSNGNGATICPLQGYLFGSAIEGSETSVGAKNEMRTSLGELFQRTKMTEENLGTEYDKEEKRAGDKSAVRIMKKLLKKKMSNASRRSSTATRGNIKSASAETKLHKILHMFHRKVHPESSTTTYRHRKHHKNENKEGKFYDGVHMLADDDDITIFPERALSKNMRRYKSQSNCNDSDENKECWIKTDADYLVLEL